MADDEDVDLTGVEQLSPNGNGAPNGDPDDDEEPDQPDEGNEEPEEPEEPELRAPAAQPERSGRRENRIRTLNERARQAEEREREANRRLDEMLRMRGQPQQPQGESQAQRDERRSRMTPEERVSEEIRDLRRDFGQQLQGSQLQNWENQDRALYETKATIDPLFRRWQDRVEKEITDMRGKGQAGVSREAVFYYLLGKSMVDQRSSKGGQQRREQAAKRVQGNTTRPSAAARSDVTSQRRSGGRSLEERLTDVQL